MILLRVLNYRDIFGAWILLEFAYFHTPVCLSDCHSVLCLSVLIESRAVLTTASAAVSMDRDGYH